MHLLADQVFRAVVSQHMQAGRIDEVADALHIYAVDAFGSGVEQQAEQFLLLEIEFLGAEAGLAEHLGVQRIGRFAGESFDKYNIAVRICLRLVMRNRHQHAHHVAVQHHRHGDRRAYVEMRPHVLAHPLINAAILDCNGLAVIEDPDGKRCLVQRQTIMPFRAVVGSGLDHADQFICFLVVHQHEGLRGIGNLAAKFHHLLENRGGSHVAPRRTQQAVVEFQHFSLQPLLFQQHPVVGREHAYFVCGTGAQLRNTSFRQGVVDINQRLERHQRLCKAVGEDKAAGDCDQLEHQPYNEGFIVEITGAGPVVLHQHGVNQQRHQRADQEHLGAYPEDGAPEFH